MMGARRSLREVGVPTVHTFGPYRFFFWSNENQKTREPPHIHVASGNGVAKFWLSPVSRDQYRGYTPRELARIERIVVANREELLRRWNEHFAD